MGVRKQAKQRQRWSKRVAALVLAASSVALLTACDGDVSEESAGPADATQDVAAEQTLNPDSVPSTNFRGVSPSSATDIQRDNTSAADALPTQNMDNQRKIAHSSEGWEFLEAPGAVMPGGRYTTDSGECSFGWWVFNKQEPDRHYMTTAGHCGEVGDQVYVEDQQGNSYNVGTFVWSQYESDTVDHALIELNVSPDAVTGTPLAEGVTLAGVADLDWLEQVKPIVCRLGFRTGMSCGQYRASEGELSFRYDGIVDHGDSGGAIWAVDPQDPSKIWAVGMTAYMFETDATNSGGSALAPMMAQFGLTIVA